MKNTILAIIISFNFASSFVVIDKPSKTKGELISVAVFFRHGDRSPKSSFPNDKYFDIRYWPMGFGQLTKCGIDRQYKLGQWLRSRYNYFLSNEYSPNDTYVYSTDVDRTLMSASANLAGLYPPLNSHIWNKNLLWQPIPIHTSPRTSDDIFTDKRDCPKYEELYEKTKKSKFFIEIDKEYAEFYSLVSEYTGWKVQNVGDIKKLRSVFDAYKNYNISFLPDWAANLDEKKLDYLSGLAYQRYTYTNKLKRLRIGPFFSYLFSHFENILSNMSSTKFLMMSGHASSLSSILNGMGVNLQPPNFAATIIWELRREVDTGSIYVNLYYRKDENHLEELKINGCEIDCGYEDFENIMKPISIDVSKWKKKCYDGYNDKEIA